MTVRKYQQPNLKIVLNVRELMEQNGLKQSELADLAKVSRRTLCKYCGQNFDRVKVDLEVLASIAIVLNLPSLDKLFKYVTVNPDKNGEYTQTKKSNK